MKVCALMNSFDCEVEGRFADEEDCTKFFECLPDLRNGGLIAYSKNCFDGGFNPEIKACVPFSKVNRLKKVFYAFILCILIAGWMQAEYKRT